MISDRLEIPYNNTIKLVAKLAKSKFLETRLGRNGGFSLGSAFWNGTILDVVDIIEGTASLSPCHQQSNDCSFSGNCDLEKTLCMLQTDINKVLESYTLKSLKFSFHQEAVTCQ